MTDSTAGGRLRSVRCSCHPRFPTAVKRCIIASSKMRPGMMILPCWPARKWTGRGRKFSKHWQVTGRFSRRCFDGGRRAVQLRRGRYRSELSCWHLALAAVPRATRTVCRTARLRPEDGLPGKAVRPICLHRNAISKTNSRTGWTGGSTPRRAQKSSGMWRPARSAVANTRRYG